MEGVNLFMVNTIFIIIKPVQRNWVKNMVVQFLLKEKINKWKQHVKKS